MTENTERERTLKLMATDENRAIFAESLPRDWRLRFARLAECVEIDLENRPERRKGSSYAWLTLKDLRNRDPERYRTKARRGQLLRSWPLGVKQRIDGKCTVEFSDGITWGSIGQYLGYLFGEIPDDEKKQLYERLLVAFKGTDRGRRLQGERILPE